jgi:hypothetical protein
LAQRTSTAVGVLQQGENYSYLPLWLDEFRESQVAEDKAGILRNAYDRAMQAKWSPDGVSRILKTGFVVSGESTSSDGATRNRYAHVQVSATRRLADHERWFTTQAPSFFVLGRMVMERRKEFVEKFQAMFRGWLKKSALSGLDDREKKVHGVAYAGLVAMASMLEAATDLNLPEFEVFMMEHAEKSAQDVTSETNINVFWADLLTAFKAGALPVVKCFRVMRNFAEHPPGADHKTESGKYIQSGWTSYELYFDPDLVISSMQIYLQKARSAVVLKRKDLRDQLAANSYWIPTQTEADGKVKKLRLRIDGEMVAAWGVRLDLHPLGYQPASDAEYEQYLLRKDEEGDPRKGSLYGIVDALLDIERAKA